MITPDYITRLEHIIAAGVDGFLIGKPSRFTSVDHQAAQAIRYVQNELIGPITTIHDSSETFS